MSFHCKFSCTISTLIIFLIIFPLHFHLHKFVNLMKMKFEHLPEECIADILSRTSPLDACQASLVSTDVRDAAQSDLLWETFLPSNYREILTTLVTPLNYASKKELFVMLSSRPHLIDGGTKAFSIDKSTGKTIYMLSARELYIPWSTNGLFWCWKPLLQSRFLEVVELVMVCWLEINGKTNTRILSPNTLYGAYLIVKIERRAFGLDTVASEVSVELGGSHLRRTVCLRHSKCDKESEKRICGMNKVEDSRSRVFREREDGWLEIELGEFYNDGLSEKEVTMSLREVKGVHLKGGIVVEGIQVRPK